MINDTLYLHFHFPHTARVLSVFKQLCDRFLCAEIGLVNMNGIQINVILLNRTHLFRINKNLFASAIGVNAGVRHFMCTNKIDVRKSS